MKLPVIGLATAGVALALDQLSKWVITGQLGLDRLAGAPIDLLPIFRVRFVANEGVSLGLLRADSELTRWLLVAMTGVIALGVFAWLWREHRRGDQLALGLVLGGALGNILDRVRLGYVVDFADLHFGEWSPFLVFNLGDAAITMGVLILLARAFLVREKPAQETVETNNA
ncbi:signal peptidase II [Sphingomonas sp.]|uniref:signal peptidase II n=1 Tax=Sphingomonas sp. TaxID=28214 RepID=UPI0025CD2AA5|nr:signal peptidase II [Sphingomonas sp.]